MPKYLCDGFRPVMAESASDAAKVFAGRQARREFGPSGYCRTIRLDTYSRDGTYAHYECFIGRDLYGLTRNACDRGTTSGHNVWVDVTKHRGEG